MISPSKKDEPVDIPSFYLEDKGLSDLAKHLRSSKGVKIKQGVLEGRRVDYFKGSKLIECMLGKDKNKTWPSHLPKIENEKIALKLASIMISKSGEYFVRAERCAPERKGHFEVHEYHTLFEKHKSDYIWMMSGSQWGSNFMTGFIIALVVAFTLLPIWPELPRQILAYSCVTLLVFIVGFCSIRLALFLIMWIVGYDFWIFPNLFDESRSFLDSFKPTVQFDKTADGQGVYRLVLLSMFGYFCYWSVTQPTEFGNFINEGQTFVEDLYNGNLLADFAATQMNAQDTLTKSRFKSFAELWEEEERDRLAETAEDSHAAATPGEGEGNEEEDNGNDSNDNDSGSSSDNSSNEDEL